MSRTEKQLAKVVFLDTPDIPSPGAVPPARPSESGLEFSKDVLVISYDVEVGKDPLKKAVKKYGASIIYDYRIANAIAVRIPDPSKINEAITHFEKVKGVLLVSRDRVNFWVWRTPFSSGSRSCTSAARKACSAKAMYLPSRFAACS
jgi:hypothetical protein